MYETGDFGHHLQRSRVTLAPSAGAYTHRTPQQFIKPHSSAHQFELSKGNIKHT